MTPPSVRFWRYVTKGADNECWLWHGSITGRSGHGTFNAGKNYQPQVMNAHVYSWILHRGPIPDGQWVLHTCDVANCVNPAHLYLGTRKDNIYDAVVRGRFLKQ